MKNPHYDILTPDLPDETNGEFFKRVGLIDFLSWMNKNNCPLPRFLKDGQRVVSAYLRHERAENMKRVNKIIVDREKKTKNTRRRAATK